MTIHEVAKFFHPWPGQPFTSSILTFSSSPAKQSQQSAGQSYLHGGHVGPQWVLSRRAVSPVCVPLQRADSVLTFVFSQTALTEQPWHGDNMAWLLSMPWCFDRYRTVRWSPAPQPHGDGGSAEWSVKTFTQLICLSDSECSIDDFPTGHVFSCLLGVFL